MLFLRTSKDVNLVWGEITRNGDRKDKRETSGYLNTWNERQIWLTALMGDIFEVFTSLEKQMQRDDLLLPDIFTCSSMAQRKLDLLSGTPYPGKRGSKTTLPWENIQTQRARQTHNTLVPTNRRNESAIRIEITSSTKNFLSERLHPEQE